MNCHDFHYNSDMTKSCIFMHLYMFLHMPQSQLYQGIERFCVILPCIKQHFFMHPFFWIYKNEYFITLKDVVISTFSMNSHMYRVYIYAEWIYNCMNTDINFTWIMNILNCLYFHYNLSFFLSFERIQQIIFWIVRILYTIKIIELSEYSKYNYFLIFRIFW